MNPSLIVMTILGCDHSATDCRYIATAENRWPSIELCDAVSEQQLGSYTNQPYPMIIAVCQKPEAGPSELVAANPRPAPPLAPEAGAPAEGSLPVTQEEKQTLADRAIERVRTVLPTTEGVKAVMTSPIRLMEGSYSWIAKRLRD